MKESRFSLGHLPKNLLCFGCKLMLVYSLGTFNRNISTSQTHAMQIKRKSVKRDNTDTVKD